MLEFLQTPTARAVLLLALMAVLIALGIYIMSRFRGTAGEDRPTASELLTNFREMHSRGGLTDEEFRTIKTMLNEQLREQLKDSEETG